MGIKNEVGNKYGRLTVIAPSEQRIRNRVCWLCKCDCGNEIVVIGTDLRTGRKTDCGCVPHYNFKDETGHKYGRLTVIKQAPKRLKSRSIYWVCECECGNIIEVVGGDLRSGKTKSCGCLEQETRGQTILKDEIGNRYGKLLVIDKIRPDNKTTYWKCQCDCGNIAYYTGPTLRQGGAKSCGCLHSLGNQKIQDFLDSHNIIYKKEVAFSNFVSSKGGHPRFDFGVYNSSNDLMFLLEYQGIQHYKDKGEFGKTQREETDILKQLYCQDNNILLYEIKYNEEIEEKMLNICKKEGILE